jgi:dTDP-4-amino-4,6-dideoxygalactose transaminase
MNDVSAAIGMANIQVACDSVLQHRKNAKFYCDRLKDCQAVKVLPYDPDCSYWLYSVLVQKGTKEQFIAYLKDHHITASPVHHRNDNYECTLRFKSDDLPGVNEFYEKQVSIPVGWWLDHNERSHIVSTVQKYDIYHRA